MVGWVRVAFLTRAWLRAALLLLTEKGITVACFGHGRPATSAFSFFFPKAQRSFSLNGCKPNSMAFKTLSLLASHDFIRPLPTYVHMSCFLPGYRTQSSWQA